jgi:uncharacterized protein involved in exopolysaccharide biosynthesis
MAIGVSNANGRVGESKLGQGDSNGSLGSAQLNPANTQWQRFADAVRLVWKKRAQVIVITALATCAAVTYSLMATPRFESTTRLLPAPPSSLLDGRVPMMPHDISALAGLVGLPSGSHADNERFVALLKSRTVADRIIDRFHLMQRYHARHRFEARIILAQRTVIQQDRKTGVITLTFSDSSPEFAAQVAQAYVEGLEKVNAEMNTSGAHLEREFLEGRVKEVDQQLREAISHLSDFSTTSGMLDPQSQPKSTVDEALKIEAQVIALRAQLSGEEQIYTPEMLKVPKARLAELERHLALLQGSRGDGSLPSLRSLPKLAATFTTYARRAKLLEAVQLYLTQKLEMAKTDEVKQLPVFRVMETAEIPEMRVWPRRTMIVLAAMAAGLIAGILFVLGLAKWKEMDPIHPMKALIFDFTPAWIWKRQPP